MKKYLWGFVFLFWSLSSFSAAVRSYEVSQKELIQMSHEVAEKLFQDNKEMWKHLLVGTLATETNLGQFKGNSPYGVAQMRNSGFLFVQRELKNRGEERDIFEELSGKSLDSMKLSMLEKDHRLAIIYMAYYYKFLVAGKVEMNSIEEAARIWKQYYNTKLGAGTPQTFLKAYQKQEKYLKPLQVQEENPEITIEEE